MAPEVLASEKYNEKADIYSFGMLVWALFTQQEPYKDFENQFVIYRFVESGNRLPLPNIDEMPRFIQEVVQGSWAQDQTQRPSMDAIVEMLKSPT